MKIHVLGWYGKSNIGDESYKTAFPLVFPGHEFQFTDKLAQADAVIVGGGDILSDPFLNQTLSCDKPLSVISASATDKTDTNKLKKFKNVYVRDFKSLEILRAKGIDAKYAPDVAFALNANKVRGREIIEAEFKSQKRDLYEKVVVVVLNGNLVDSEASGYDGRKFISFQNLAFQLGHVADFTNASFLFVPFGQDFPWDDRVPNAWVAQRCKWWKKNVVLWNQSSDQNVLNIISAADAVVSTRLHSTIFSITAGTPFVDITHNHKNTALLESTGTQKYSIPYHSFDGDRAKSLLKQLLEQPTEPKKELEEILNKQRKLLRELGHVRLL